MDQQQAREYLLNKPFSVETFPFGEDVSVFKVKHKMFATLARGKMGKSDNESEDIYWMNLKSDPHEALWLRAIVPSGFPGGRMRTGHWTTVQHRYYRALSRVQVT
jgi:predicted DNA-binding protein (MmcQ/YjbR family)